MIAALVKSLASILGWIGLDFGISYLTGSGDSYTYVYGLDFASFLEAYWVSLLIYLLAALTVVWFAVPKGGRA